MYICIYTRTAMLLFEWDDEKSRSNLENHGLMFEDAPLVFGGLCWTIEDKRRDCGEPRQITFGQLHGRLVVVAHTPRPGRTRIISMRKANQREEKAYQERLEENRRDEG